MCLFFYSHILLSNLWHLTVNSIDNAETVPMGGCCIVVLYCGIFLNIKVFKHIAVSLKCLSF